MMSWSFRSRPLWGLGVALCFSGCTDGGANSESASSETGAESGTGETGGETGGELLDGAIEVITYETQPMVVDVVVSLVPEAQDAEVSVVHLFDEGVRVAPLTDRGTATERHFRVRGLAPITQHGVDVTVSLDGVSVTETAEFMTELPLPGFVPSFEVTTNGNAETAYRLMDWSNFGGEGAPPVGLMQLDAEGVTRWYLGRTDTTFGPAATMAGVELLDDGTVLFQQNGFNEIVDELGVTLATYRPADAGDVYYHHDVTRLPNGNVLTLGYEFTDAEYPEGTLHVAGDHLTEFDPEGNKVWSWSSFDHLDLTRRREGFDDMFPPLIDPTTGEQSKDWTHANGVVYDPSDDSILMSLRHQDWIIKIDHATGDVIWRFGDEGDFTLETGSWFFHQHSPQWQPDGSMLLYDNGNGNPYLPLEEEFSRAVIYDIDETTMTASLVWEDDAEDFMSEAMGDADRMPGGHILVTDSALSLNVNPQMIHARVRELDPEASPQTVWSFQTEPGQGRFVYRAVPTTRLVGEAQD